LAEYATQLEAARGGIVTPQMKEAARKEGIDPELLAERVARGTAVLPCNPAHATLEPLAIGEGLRIKVNANIGTSEAAADPEKEVEKLRAALDAGADAVMDLSTGDPEAIDSLRRTLIGKAPVPFGTVPIYEAAVIAQEHRGAIVEMTAGDLFETIERHARCGVDFITVHCGVTHRSVERLRRQGRETDVVSRGGAMLVGWMAHHDAENPLYERFDDLLDIARKYDVTLSLGDGLRPGSLSDATDRAQVEELVILGELVRAARDAEVQVMVEGPGHVPLDDVEMNVRLEKRLCDGAPFYVLGPIVTDVAPGYDHISSAIGGAVAGMAGADFLCYVTPAEHLGLPDPDDVREGVIAARIAAHAADAAKGTPGARDWDVAMSRARKRLDWDEQIRLAIDPRRAAEYRKAKNPRGGEECTMCGRYCAMKIAGEYLGRELGSC